MRTTEQIAESLRNGTPWLSLFTDPDRQASLQHKANLLKAWLDALCEATAKPEETRRRYRFTLPRANRLRQFGRDLANRGLLTREKLAEIEANYGNP